MAGLLNPYMSMGMGILAGNKGPYAFQNAMRGGLLGAEQTRQNELAQSQMDYRKAQMAQMPGDAAYKKALAHRAMNTTEAKSNLEKMAKYRDSLPPGHPDIKRINDYIERMGSAPNYTFGVPSNPTTTGLEAVKKILNANPNIDLTTLDSDGRKAAAATVEAEAKAIQREFVGKKQPAPSLPDAINMVISDPNSMTNRILSDPDNVGAIEWVQRLFGFGDKANSLLNPTPPTGTVKRKEGGEWVGEDGRKRKMINGVVNVQKGQ